LVNSSLRELWLRWRKNKKGVAQNRGEAAPLHFTLTGGASLATDQKALAPRPTACKKNIAKVAYFFERMIFSKKEGQDRGILPQTDGERMRGA
jgi:hypothetical protein